MSDTLRTYRSVRKDLHQLLGRYEREMKSPPPAARICNGTLISGSQYETDIAEWKYMDGRELIKKSRRNL